MCSQPASEPWAEPHRAVPDPATRPHHHLDVTRPSGVLTPNNADYTTGNVIIQHLELLHGTLTEADLPDQDTIPLDARAGELSSP